MKHLFIIALASLLVGTMTTEVAFAKRSVREVFRPELIRKRIMDRVGQTAMNEGAYIHIARNQANRISTEVARSMRQEGVGIPETQIARLLQRIETTEALREATRTEQGQSLVENVELAIAVREGIRRAELEGIGKEELTLLDQAAENALHAVAALAQVPASKLAAFESDIALHALIRQVSQIEPLLKEYTTSERESWNRQLQSYKDNLGKVRDPIKAYRESIKEVVANEKGVPKEEVTETMLREKLDEIRRCRV